LSPLSHRERVARAAGERRVRGVNLAYGENHAPHAIPRPRWRSRLGTTLCSENRIEGRASARAESSSSGGRQATVGGRSRYRPRTFRADTHGQASHYSSVTGVTGPVCECLSGQRRHHGRQEMPTQSLSLFRNRRSSRWLLFGFLQEADDERWKMLLRPREVQVS